MLNKENILAKNALIYSVFTVFQRGLGLFLLPVYTSVLMPEQLGIISTSTAIIAFFVLLFGLSLRGSTAFYYYEYKDTNPIFFKKILGTCTVLILLFSLLAIVILLLTQNWILLPLFENIAFKPYIILSLIAMFFQPLYFYYQSLLKAQQKAKSTSLLDFSYFFVMICLTLILILGFGFKAEGALLANAAASLLVFALSVWGLFKQSVLCFSKSILKKVLKYSLPLLPHNISGWAMNMVDKVMLNALTSLSSVAFYDVGSQIAKVVNMITLGVNSAYAPWFFDQVKNEEGNQYKIKKVTHHILLIYIIVAVSISWLAPEVLKIISKPAYYESWVVVPLISTAFVINGFYYTFSSVFFLNKTKQLSLLTMSAAVFNIALNFILIKKMGFMGAAWASLVTKLVFTTITYYFSQKIYFINYNLKYIMFIISLGFILSSLPFVIQPLMVDYNFWTVLVIKIAVLLIFASYFIYIKLHLIKAFLENK